MSTKPIKPCCRDDAHASTKWYSKWRVKKTAGSVPSVLLSTLIAFFPKCPLCWAVYMSMFSSIGLAKLPYLKWLLPVLLCILAIHLFMLYRKARRMNYYLPLVISVMGALIILIARSLTPVENWLLITGMVFTISGSLFNSFIGTRLTLSNYQI